MAAIGLPFALILGMLVELVSGLVSRPLGGGRAWWRGVSGIGSEMRRLVRDRTGGERVTVVEAGGAAASMLGAGTAAAGALGLGPDGLILLYLALALASAGALVAGWEYGGNDHRRLLAVLAEPAFAIGLAVMFVRFGALDLDAVRGTQQILGTGLVLGPVPTAVGLVAGAKALAWASALRLNAEPRRQDDEVPGAGAALLIRLCHWSVAGATSLVAGVLLAGGTLQPLSADGLLRLVAGAGGFAIALGMAGAVLRLLPEGWLPAVVVLALVLAAAGAAAVVLS